MALRFQPPISPEAYYAIQREKEGPSFQERVINPFQQGLQSLVQMKELERQRAQEERQTGIEDLLTRIKIGQSVQDYGPEVLLAGAGEADYRPFAGTGGETFETGFPGSQRIGGIQPRAPLRGFAEQFERFRQTGKTKDVLGQMEQGEFGGFESLPRRKREEVERLYKFKEGQKERDIRREETKAFREATLGLKQEKEERAQKKEEEKSQFEREGALLQADRVISKVDQALEKVGPLTAGLGSYTSFIPGTPAKNLDKILETIKANIGFSELQAMRRASPTGGALGQIAVQELNFLQAVIASLDQAQSPGQLKKMLDEVKTHFENWKSTVEGKMPERTRFQEDRGILSANEVIRKTQDGRYIIYDKKTKKPLREVKR